MLFAQKFDRYPTKATRRFPASKRTYQQKAGSDIQTPNPYVTKGSLWQRQDLPESRKNLYPHFFRVGAANHIWCKRHTDFPPAMTYKPVFTFILV